MLLRRLATRGMVQRGVRLLRRETNTVENPQWVRTFATTTTTTTTLQRARYTTAAEKEMRDRIEVLVDHTPNPDCLKFSPETDEDDIMLLDHGVVMDISKLNAEKSPLAETIFQIDGIVSICIADYWLTVTKQSERDWEELSPLITDAIKDWKISGEPITDEEVFGNEDTEIDENFDVEVVQAIKELVKTRIRPGVQQDGGNIKYIGFEDGVVLLLMQGACQSCPSSSATLKGGIEKMMMHWIPEVLEVRAVDEDFAEEYIAEMVEMKKKYKLEGDKLVPKDQNDDDLMNTGV
eukprot:TRINITY_DN13676_c2_g1_i1.p1 TRINITY_DN13676_c2_g1~~TRINITY_DN13676_c2_g1_i1.p1  ORF type:complete len:293 (+),score=68.19 TRINITY_DN13676_c2_g1_i1:101-979(+)